MKKSLAAIATALAFSCGPAFSQSAPALDPAAVEATKQLLQVIKARELMLSSIQQMEQRLPDQMRASIAAFVQSDTSMNAQQKREAMASIERVIPLMVAQVHGVMADPVMIDEIMAEMVPVYVQNYTVDEIKQLTALYQTPLGQKILASMPKIAAQSMDISTRVMMPRIQKIMAQMASSLTSK